MKPETRELLYKELTNERICDNLIEREYIFHEVVDTDINEFTFQNLENFGYYYISIRACFRDVGCTDPTLHLTQTDRNHSADMIEGLSGKAVGSSRIELSWKPPARPNGVVLTFIVRFQIAATSSVLCVPYSEFVAGDMKKTVDHLTAGAYKISVTVRSLGGAGSSSDEIEVTLKQSNHVVWMLIAFGLLLSMLLIFVFLQKRRIAALRAKEMKNFPMFIRDPDDNFELERENIEMGQELGAGHFGFVYEGILRNYEDNLKNLSVAVKTVITIVVFGLPLNEILYRSMMRQRLNPQ